jgi:hypothetical protein
MTTAKATSALPASLSGAIAEFSPIDLLDGSQK